ncbi:MAG: phytanoyl-CoA dioxygenase family protein [bacterium]|nr:phytanoyl-CoA dioxygenase family protein [bacterium]
MANCLTEVEMEHFHKVGYLVFEGLLDAEQCERLARDVDRLEADRQNPDARPMIVSYRELGLLTSEPKVMDRVEDLMKTTFALHHIHATRQGPGTRASRWHQDYEQHPQTNRSHLMVHVFFYLNGLNGEVGDLLVLPGSHKTVTANNAFGLFETEDLPGSLTFNDLAPGSAVIVHSALQHARRARPGGENRPRYFIDSSYCQSGVLWPAYRNHAQINQTALEMGWDRNGRYAFV